MRDVLDFVRTEALHNGMTLADFLFMLTPPPLPQACQTEGTACLWNGATGTDCGKLERSERLISIDDGTDDGCERAPPNPSHAGWYSIYLPQ